MDFFTVPTLTFGVLYCYFVIAHNRRRILHCNVTKHPTSAWVIQQLRETFPYDSSPSYLIFDRAVTGCNNQYPGTNTDSLIAWHRCWNAADADLTLCLTRCR